MSVLLRKQCPKRVPSKIKTPVDSQTDLICVNRNLTDLGLKQAKCRDEVSLLRGIPISGSGTMLS